jgi:hypothetical protein
MNYTYTLNSWGDFLNTCSAPVDIKDEARASRVSEKNDGHGDDGDGGTMPWSGTDTYEEATQLAFKGWEKGLYHAARISQRLFNHVSRAIERDDVYYDIHGHYIDVARFNDNEPECWGAFEKVQAVGEGKRLVRVLFNISTSAGIDAEVMIRKGATCAALIELLEYAGHRVELTLSQATDGYQGDNLDIRIKVKEFDQNLDMGRVIFAVAHPAMLRRMIFSYEEVQLTKDGIASKFGVPDGGYGRPREAKAENGEIYIGSSHLDNKAWQDDAAAEKWVMKKLADQGVQLSNRSGVTAPVGW